MNDNDVWAAIDGQRRRTIDLLESLSTEDWRQPSLCEGWTVRDVAAHLTLQQLTLRDALGLAVRHPAGLVDVNRMIHDSAVRRAQRPVEQLIDEIRGMIGSNRHNVGVTNLETLIDILVHGQDIAIPLGRDLEMPVDAAAVAAQRVWSSGQRRKARVLDNIPLGGFRLVATDTSWAVGEGREVRGPISALLLLLAGRRAALPRLSGDGADGLREQARRH